MELPEQRRHLDQKRCRYVPHILLVPKDAGLQMQNSDATLHVVHMDGAASFNLPFPFTNQITSRTMSTPGLVNLRCNGGHVELTSVPSGTYQIVAWHEGWVLTGKQQAYDVLTEHTVERPVFAEPKIWEKPVTVNANQTSVVNFVFSSK